MLFVFDKSVQVCLTDKGWATNPNLFAVPGACYEASTTKRQLHLEHLQENASGNP
jgi:hypothetical protein